MTAGGVHFKTSCACLIGTGTFVMTGVFVSRHLDIGLMNILVIYAVCFIALIVIGPQGSSEINSAKLSSSIIINNILMEVYEKIMKSQKQKGMRWSTVSLLILAVFFYIHYCIYSVTNIYALQATVFGYLAMEFLSVIIQSKDIKEEWHYLVLGVMAVICFVITFALYFSGF